MKKSAMLAAAAGLALGGTVRADFIVTTSNLQDAGNGNERVLVYALNNGANGTGTKALASDVTIQDVSGNALVVVFPSDVTGKAFLGGGGLPSDSNETFVNLLPDPTDPNYDPTAYSVVSTSPSRGGNHGPITQLEVVGANLLGGVDATSSTNGGKGVLIADAVAPGGDPIHVFGSLGGDAGSPQLFDITIPEPTSAALLVFAFPAVFRRRRSQ